jgi:DNA-binding response OmpR family regulator
MTSPPVRPLVLLVEDDRDTREMYGLYLEYRGLSVIATDNASTALSLAFERRPDIVVTDYRLGGSANGADLCRQLRDDARTAVTPVIVMTGSTRPLDAETARASGATIFRIKPYLPDALVADIRSILGEHPRHRLAG